MAYIKYSKKKELVYEEFNDRGTWWNELVPKDVEHWNCSECGTEVGKDFKFCSECGEKFNKRNSGRKI